MVTHTHRYDIWQQSGPLAVTHFDECHFSLSPSSECVFACMACMQMHLGINNSTWNPLQRLRWSFIISLPFFLLTKNFIFLSLTACKHCHCYFSPDCAFFLSHFMSLCIDYCIHLRPTQREQDRIRIVSIMLQASFLWKSCDSMAFRVNGWVNCCLACCWCFKHVHSPEGKVTLGMVRKKWKYLFILIIITVIRKN